MPERDWKVFRELRELALQRFCEQVLKELSETAATQEKSAHERYLAIYSLIRERDKELAFAFNNPRRSVAFNQLLTIRRLGLITNEEFTRFTPETQERVSHFLRAIEEP